MNKIFNYNDLEIYQLQILKYYVDDDLDEIIYQKRLSNLMNKLLIYFSNKENKIVQIFTDKQSIKDIREKFKTSWGNIIKNNSQEIHLSKGNIITYCDFHDALDGLCGRTLHKVILFNTVLSQEEFKDLWMAVYPTLCLRCNQGISNLLETV